MRILFILMPLMVNAACHEIVSVTGKSKYMPNETLSYTSPNARSGGTMRLSSIGTFNHFDPMSVKGILASGTGLMYETLMTNVVDDKYAVYPLLAEKVCVDKSAKKLTWYLNPAAEWHNGDSVTAQDVKFSYEYAQKSDSLSFKRATKDIEKITILDANRVEMQMTDVRPITVMKIAVVPILPVNHPVFLKQNKPIGSGPYKLNSYKKGRTVHYKKNENYWGKNLGVNRYRYSFDTVFFEYFLSSHAAFKAFKSDKLDYWFESIARRWKEKYPIKESNHWTRACYPTMNEVQMQGFVINVRNPMLRDPTLRLALVQAVNFEWLNKSMFFDQYERLSSFFTRTPYEAKDDLSQAEAAIARSLPHTMPLSDLSKDSLSRKYSISEIRKMLQEKGFTYKGKQLFNPDGHAVKLKMPYQGAHLQRVVIAYRAMLAELGIDLDVQLLSSPDFMNAQRKHQYDLIWSAVYHNDVPSHELFLQLHSSQSDKPGLVNNSGLKNANIDYLIEKNLNTPINEKVAYLQLMDRLLQHHHLVVPHWYLNCHRVAYAKSLEHANAAYVADDLFAWWFEGSPSVNSVV